MGKTIRTIIVLLAAVLLLAGCDPKMDETDKQSENKTTYFPEAFDGGFWAIPSTAYRVYLHDDGGDWLVSPVEDESITQWVERPIPDVTLKADKIEWMEWGTTHLILTEFHQYSVVRHTEDQTIYEQVEEGKFHEGELEDTDAKIWQFKFSCLFIAGKDLGHPMGQRDLDRGEITEKMGMAIFDGVEHSSEISEISNYPILWRYGKIADPEED